MTKRKRNPARTLIDILLQVGWTVIVILGPYLETAQILKNVFYLMTILMVSVPVVYLGAYLTGHPLPEIKERPVIKWVVLFIWDELLGILLFVIKGGIYGYIWGSILMIAGIIELVWKDLSWEEYANKLGNTIRGEDDAGQIGFIPR